MATDRCASESVTVNVLPAGPSTCVTTATVTPNLVCVWYLRSASRHSNASGNEPLSAI